MHPISVPLSIGYLFGVNLTRKAGSSDLWHPEITPETEEDIPGEDQGHSVLGTWAGIQTPVGRARRAERCRDPTGPIAWSR